MPPLPLPKMIPFYAPEESPIWTCLRQPGLLIDHGELRTISPLILGSPRCFVLGRWFSGEDRGGSCAHAQAAAHGRG